MNVLGLPLPPRDSLVWLVVSWLLVWRVTALLVRDRGPFEVLARLRAGLAKRGLHELILCFHCTAVWVAVLATVALYEWRWPAVAIALALAGAASVTERFLGGSDSAGLEDDDA
jgi:Protein of unknown function (DUF1360)